MAITDSFVGFLIDLFLFQVKWLVIHIFIIGTTMRVSSLIYIHSQDPYGNAHIHTQVTHVHRHTHKHSHTHADTQRDVEWGEAENATDYTCLLYSKTQGSFYKQGQYSGVGSTMFICHNLIDDSPSLIS